MEDPLKREKPTQNPDKWELKKYKDVVFHTVLLDIKKRHDEVAWANPARPVECCKTVNNLIIAAIWRIEILQAALHRDAGALELLPGKPPLPFEGTEYHNMLLKDVLIDEFERHVENKEAEIRELKDSMPTQAEKEITEIVKARYNEGFQDVSRIESDLHDAIQRGERYSEREKDYQANISLKEYDLKFFKERANLMEKENIALKKKVQELEDRLEYARWEDVDERNVETMRDRHVRDILNSTAPEATRIRAQAALDRLHEEERIVEEMVANHRLEIPYKHVVPEERVPKREAELQKMADNQNDQLRKMCLENDQLETELAALKVVQKAADDGDVDQAVRDLKAQLDLTREQLREARTEEKNAKHQRDQAKTNYRAAEDELRSVQFENRRLRDGAPVRAEITARTIMTPPPGRNKNLGTLNDQPWRGADLNVAEEDEEADREKQQERDREGLREARKTMHKMQENAQRLDDEHETLHQRNLELTESLRRRDADAAELDARRDAAESRLEEFEGRYELQQRMDELKQRENKRLREELIKAKGEDEMRRIDLELAHLRESELSLHARKPSSLSRRSSQVSLLDNEYGRDKRWQLDRDIKEIEKKLKSKGIDGPPFNLPSSAYDDEDEEDKVKNLIRDWHAKCKERDSLILEMEARKAIPDDLDPAERLERLEVENPILRKENMKLRHGLRAAEGTADSVQREMDIAREQHLAREALLQDKHEGEMAALEREMKLMAGRFRNWQARSRERVGSASSRGQRRARSLRKLAAEQDDAVAGSEKGSKESKDSNKSPHSASAVGVPSVASTSPGSDSDLSGASVSSEVARARIRTVMENEVEGLVDDLDELINVPVQVDLSYLRSELDRMRGHMQAADEHVTDMHLSMQRTFASDPENVIEREAVEAVLAKLQPYYEGVGGAAGKILTDIDKAEGAWLSARTAIGELRHEKEPSEQLRADLRALTAQFGQHVRLLRERKVQILEVVTEEQQLEERLNNFLSTNRDLLRSLKLGALRAAKRGRDEHICDLRIRLEVDHDQFETALEDVIASHRDRLKAAAEEVASARKVLNEARDQRLSFAEEIADEAERGAGQSENIAGPGSPYFASEQALAMHTSHLDLMTEAHEKVKGELDLMLQAQKLAHDKAMMDQLRETHIDQWIAAGDLSGQKAQRHLQELVDASRTPRDLFALVAGSGSNSTSSPPSRRLAASPRNPEVVATTIVDALAKTMQRHISGSSGQMALAGAHVADLEATVAALDKELGRVRAEADLLEQRGRLRLRALAEGKEDWKVQDQYANLDVDALEAAVAEAARMRRANTELADGVRRLEEEAREAQSERDHRERLEMRSTEMEMEVRSVAARLARAKAEKSETEADLVRERQRVRDLEQRLSELRADYEARMRRAKKIDEVKGVPELMETLRRTKAELDAKQDEIELLMAATRAAEDPRISQQDDRIRRFSSSSPAVVPSFNNMRAVSTPTTASFSTVSRTHGDGDGGDRSFGEGETSFNTTTGSSGIIVDEETAAQVNSLINEIATSEEAKSRLEQQLQLLGHQNVGLLQEREEAKEARAAEVAQLRRNIEVLEDALEVKKKEHQGPSAEEVEGLENHRKHCLEHHAQLQNQLDTMEPLLRANVEDDGRRRAAMQAMKEAHDGIEDQLRRNAEELKGQAEIQDRLMTKALAEAERDRDAAVEKHEGLLKQADAALMVQNEIQTLVDPTADGDAKEAALKSLCMALGLEGLPVVLELQKQNAELAERIASAESETAKAKLGVDGLMTMLQGIMARMAAPPNGGGASAENKENEELKSTINNLKDYVNRLRAGETTSNVGGDIRLVTVAPRAGTGHGISPAGFMTHLYTWLCLLQWLFFPIRQPRIAFRLFWSTIRGADDEAEAVHSAAAAAAREEHGGDHHHQIPRPLKEGDLLNLFWGVSWVFMVMSWWGTRQESNIWLHANPRVQSGYLYDLQFDGAKEMCLPLPFDPRLLFVRFGALGGGLGLEGKAAGGGGEGLGTLVSLCMSMAADRLYWHARSLFVR